MMHRIFITLPVLFSVAFFSGQATAGVNDEDMPLVEANFEQFGGTVKSMIDKKKQSVIQKDSDSTVSASPQGKQKSHVVNAPEIDPQALQPVTFVGMHEMADGSRVAEVYFQGNILHYHQHEALPNKEKIKKIEDRVLTTNVRQYWLSPTPQQGVLSPVFTDTLVPAGLIQ